MSRSFPLLARAGDRFYFDGMSFVREHRDPAEFCIRIGTEDGITGAESFEYPRVGRLVTLRHFGATGARMRVKLRVLSLLGTAVLPACADTPVSGPSLDSPTGSLALVGGTIYTSPTEEPVQDGVLLIEGGTIAAVGSRARVQIPHTAEMVDCSGLTIVAGLWNSHVHFFERKWADAASIPTAELGRQLQDMFTRYGFTSVFDLSSPWENTRRLRDRIESGEVPGPRIHSTGQGLVPPGAVPPEPVLKVMGIMMSPLPEVADAAQAAAASRELLDDGVDGIKVFVSSSSPGMASLPDSAIRAAVGEAHRVGRPVFAHPNSAADVLAALRCGVDVIAHTTPRSGPWDEAILAAMKEGQAALTPTLTLWKHFLRHDRLSTQEQMAITAIGQLRAWLASGGTVLFGTDAGAVDCDPSEEYALMAEAGMGFRQVLASLTTAPAERFGESKRRGRIAAGFEADVVVLNGDPGKNIRALAAVRYTLRDGKIVYRADE